MWISRILVGIAFIMSGQVGLALTAGIQVNVGLAPCGQPRGNLQGWATGGVPPYTVSWSNGDTSWIIEDLPAGNYVLTVTDDEGTVATANADIVFSATYPTMDPVVSLSYCGSGAPYAVFPRFQDGQGPWPVEPTTFSGFPVVGQFPAGDWWGIELTNMGAGVYQIDYSDAVGCTGMFNWTVYDPVTFPGIMVSGIGGSCSDGSIGTATVEVPFLIGENDLHLKVRDAMGNVFYETECLGENPGGWNGVIVPFTSLPPGDYWAVLDVDEYCLFDVLPGFLANCTDSVMFTIPDLGITCGEVVGALYVDADGDCTHDANENLVPHTVIAVDPGNTYTSTGSNGWYSTGALPGLATFAAQHPVLAQACPGDVDVVSGTTQTLDLGMSPDAPLDAVVTIGGSPMRPGMQASYWIQARNLSDAATGTVTLTVDLDPVLNYIGATPTPTSVVGNMLAWTDPDFSMNTVFEQDQFHVQVSLPPNPLLVGTIMSTTASLAVQNPDADPGNNTASLNTTVTASLDPNDKLARTSSQGSNENYYLDLDAWIDYTIRFQNTGTDTAFNVVITDTLPPTLDPTSLLVGASSHPMSWSISGPGVLRFHFPDILLPDSTTDEPKSHGLVTFRIMPQVLTPGTVIENEAGIYFDFNDPVITEPSVLVAEFSTGVEEHGAEVMIIFPNPTMGIITLTGAELIDARVLSLDGKLLYTARSATKPIATIDLSGLSPGTYLLEGKSADGNRRTVRFTKL